MVMIFWTVGMLSQVSLEAESNTLRMAKVGDSSQGVFWTCMKTLYISQRCNIPVESIYLLLHNNSHDSVCYTV